MRFLAASWLVLAAGWSPPPALPSPVRWPDDCLLRSFDAYAELLRLEPRSLESNARGVAFFATREAARRGLVGARPLLSAIKDRAVEPFVFSSHGQNLPEEVSLGLARLEARTREWDRLVSQYVPAIRKGCPDAKPANFVFDQAGAQAGRVLDGMARDPEGVRVLRGLARDRSACVRDRALSALLGTIGRPAPADRELLRLLLDEPDAAIQRPALHGLLLNRSREEQLELAAAYLRLPARTGRWGEELANRVLAGQLTEREFTTRDDLMRQVEERDLWTQQYVARLSHTRWARANYSAPRTAYAQTLASVAPSAGSSGAPPTSGPRLWPDDAIEAVLLLCKEIVRLKPDPTKTRVKEWLLPAAAEAGDRGQLSALPLLEEIFLGLDDSNERAGPPEARASYVVARAFAQIEVGTRDWKRLVGKYAGLPGDVCGASRPDRKLLLAHEVLVEMAADDQGVVPLHELSKHPSRCVRRGLAIALGTRLARPSPKDREVMRALLEERDEVTQLYALRGLLKNASDAERAVEAKRYLASAGKTGLLATKLAKKALEKNVTEAELASEEDSWRHLRAPLPAGP